VTLLLSILVSSCSSYKGTTNSEDGIYKQSDKEVVVVKETQQKSKENNFFANELEKYEDLNEKDEILLDAEDYSSKEDYNNEENEESNAAWGYETQDVDVTYHVNYNWYHPYHSPYYYGNNWGHHNWYYNSYHYRPWGYYGYAYYGHPYYYGGYYSPYYTGYYSPYNNWGGYGYYNTNYYGGYGYNAYNHNYTRPYNEYGRRTGQRDRFTNRRSMSSSVVNSNKRGERPSLIRGSGTVSEAFNRRGVAKDPNNTTTLESSRNRIQRGNEIRNNTSGTRPNTTTRDNSSRTRTTDPSTNNTNRRTVPNQTKRTTTPARTKTKTTTKKSTSRTSTKNNSSSTRGYSSGSSSSNSGSSTSKGSSSSGSRGSSGSSGSSRGGRR